VPFKAAKLQPIFKIDNITVSQLDSVTQKRCDQDGDVIGEVSLVQLAFIQTSVLNSTTASHHNRTFLKRGFGPAADSNDVAYQSERTQVKHRCQG
jgi:hypothetical protein